MKSDGQSFLYIDFYNGWGCDGEVVLEICPTLQKILDVDGARSMVMMAVVEVVISCHGFLFVGYYFVFGIFSFLWILVDGYDHYMNFFFN